jgi:hypothetical protein
MPYPETGLLVPAPAPDQDKVTEVPALASVAKSETVVGAEQAVYTLAVTLAYTLLIALLLRAPIV